MATELVRQHAPITTVLPARTVQNVVNMSPTKVQNLLTWCYSMRLTQEAVKMAEKGYQMLPDVVTHNLDQLDQYADSKVTAVHSDVESKIHYTRNSVQAAVDKVMSTANSHKEAMEVVVTTSVNRVMDVADGVVDKYLPETERIEPQAQAAPMGAQTDAEAQAQKNKVYTRVSDSMHRVRSRTDQRVRAAASTLTTKVMPYVPRWPVQVVPSVEQPASWASQTVEKAKARAHDIHTAITSHAHGGVSHVRGVLARMKATSDAWMGELKTQSSDHISGGYQHIHAWLAATHAKMENLLKTAKENPHAASMLSWTSMQYSIAVDAIARAREVGMDSLETSACSLRSNANQRNYGAVRSAMVTVAELLEKISNRSKQTQLASTRPGDALIEELKERQAKVRPTLSPTSLETDRAAGTKTKPKTKTQAEPVETYQADAAKPDTSHKTYAEAVAEHVEKTE